MTEAALQACAVTRTIGSVDARRTLYADLDLDLRPGTITAIVGPNGAGKTSLLRDLVGLSVPTAGKVRLEGRDLLSWSHRERARRVAYLPQRFPMPAGLDVHAIVTLGRTPHMGWWSGPSFDDRRAVTTAMRVAGVERLVHRSASTLSGGELQRVMIARMLAARTGVLVLDEPTTALDIRHALHVLELLAMLAEAGHTVCVALHELELATRFAHQAVLLHGSEGTWTVGPVTDTLASDRLESVFGVEVAPRSFGRVFRLPDATRAGIEAAIRAR